MICLEDDLNFSQHSTEISLDLGNLGVVSGAFGEVLLALVVGRIVGVVDVAVIVRVNLILAVIFVFDLVVVLELDVSLVVE